uniref:hypothetical protein n=1 Tax=Carboxylicivirga marina TaxID=2800988 RepID=UPI001F47D932
SIHLIKVKPFIKGKSKLLLRSITKLVFHPTTGSIARQATALSKRCFEWCMSLTIISKGSDISNVDGHLSIEVSVELKAV